MLFISYSKRENLLANLIHASTAFSFLIVTALTGIIGVSIAADRVNKKGKHFNFSVKVGKGYIAII